VAFGTWAIGDLAKIWGNLQLGFGPPNYFPNWVGGLVPKTLCWVGLFGRSNKVTRGTREPWEEPVAKEGTNQSGLQLLGRFNGPFKPWRTGVPGTQLQVGGPNKNWKPHWVAQLEDLFPFNILYPNMDPKLVVGSPY